jgi:molybdopterin synthase catalytic subunit
MKHRIGRLAVGEVAVVVAASAPHREEAFAACRAGIEEIKARGPVWIREWGPDGSVWVDPLQPRPNPGSC